MPPSTETVHRATRETWESSHRVETEAPEAFVRECGVSLLAAAYETWRGRPLLPAQAMTNFREDLEVYNLSRHIKRPDDAIEYFLGRNIPQHTKQFLEVGFALVEDAYEKGVNIKDLLDVVDKITGRAVLDIQDAQKQPSDLNVSDTCKLLWDKAIQREYELLYTEQ